MKISRRSWHYKLFRFCDRLWWRFRDRDVRYYEEPVTIDLCTYMRRILVTTPLVLLAYAVTLLIAYGAFVAMPMDTGGIGFYGYVLLGTLIVCGLVVGVGVAFAAVIFAPKALRNKAREEGSAVNLTVSWVRARKASICPILRPEDKP